MAYDDSSVHGDMIVDEYDDHNNFVGTNTPMGFLVYHLLGYSFDKMSEASSKFLRYMDILSTDDKYLDNYWGVVRNLPRPKLSNDRLLTDKEYRVYLYLRSCRLMTRQDILINFRKAFGFDDYDVYIDKESSSSYLRVVDHLHYEAKEDTTTNICKRDNDTSNDYVIDFAHEDDENVHRIESGLSIHGSTAYWIIWIPFDNWDSLFLSFLEQYISVRGNLKIKEYML